MNDLGRDLSAMLERATTGVDAAPSGRERALRRARRRRLRNAAIAGAATVAVFSSGYVAATRVLDRGRAAQVVGERDADEPVVRDGEVEIARGELDGSGWVLSAVSQGCLSLTRAEEPGSGGRGSCSRVARALEFDEYVFKHHVLVAGHVAPNVKEVRLRYSILDSRGAWTTGSPSVPLRSAPEALRTTRSYFVIPVELGKGGFAVITAYSAGGGHSSRKVESVGADPGACLPEVGAEAGVSAKNGREAKLDGDAIESDGTREALEEAKRVVDRAAKEVEKSAPSLPLETCFRLEQTVGTAVAVATATPIPSRRDRRP